MKNFGKYFVFTFATVAIFFVSNFININVVLADTDIPGGPITVDTTWTKANSPYIVYGDILVAKDVTLTIEPGVVVKAGYVYFDILGNLNIQGTINERVTISSLSPLEYQWNGFCIIDGGSYSISFADISDAWMAVYAYQSNGVINNIKVLNSNQGVYIEESTLDINNSYFENIEFNALDAFHYSTIIASLLEIKNINSIGINLDYYSTIDLNDSIISDSLIGVTLAAYSSADITKIKINNNLLPVQIYEYSSARISNLEIIDTYNSSAEAVGVYGGSSLLLASSSILNTMSNRAVFMCDSGSILNIKDSIIDGGVGDGISISGGLSVNIDNTIIRNFFDKGLIISGKKTSAIISNSELSGNDYGLKGYGASIEVKNSHIKNNESFGIYNIPSTWDAANGFVLPQVKASNNWWGDASGPYNELTNASGTANRISANVEFQPWLAVDPSIPIIPPKVKNPVIIIPGILSSYLNENTSNEEVWPNIAKALLPFSDDSYLDKLALDLLGQPNLSFPVMIPTDIFRKIEIMGLGIKDIFTGLIINLENDGYIENESLFVFPYDWRLNIVNSVSNIYSPLLISLKDKVDQVLAKTGAEKVDIVAHSMGGLLTKYYIEHYGQGKVDKFVDIATPHFGAPGTLKTLIYGDDIGMKLGWLGLNPLEIKKISQNSPAVYQLLPSANYFSASLPDYNYYIYDMDDYDNNGIRGKLSYEQSLDFLTNTGRNDLVMNNAVKIHNDLDNMNPADYGVKTYNIVGCGMPTIGKIFTLGKQTDTDPQYDVAYISGDGTVPQKSAEGITSQEQYYVSGVQHANMPSTSGIKELVSSLLAGTENNFDFASSTNIATTSVNCKLPNGTFLGFHSPVELHIYDEAGNHIGPNANGDLEENIPNIAYDIIDGNKFAFLPDGENYQIELKATEEGSFSSHIKKIKDGEVISTSYFSDIHLSGTSTTAEVNINNLEPTISLDSSGTGINKEIIIPSAVMSRDSLQDLTAPVTDLNIISFSTDGIYYGSVSFNFTATDTDSGVLKTEYSLNNDANYLKATSTITISNLGTSTIYYRSIDKAGNIENLKSITIKIAEIMPIKVSKKSGGSHHISIKFPKLPPVLPVILIDQSPIKINLPVKPPVFSQPLTIKAINLNVAIKKPLALVSTSKPVSTSNISPMASVSSANSSLFIKTVINVFSELVFLFKKYMIKLW